VRETWTSKISTICSKGNIFKLRLNEEQVGKMCVFQRKTGRISKTVGDTANVTINH